MRTICEACVKGEHPLCHALPDLDVEMRFKPCLCKHDPMLVQGDAQVTSLLVAGEAAWARGDLEAAGNALEQALFLMQPWRAVAAARRPLRLVKGLRPNPSSPTEKQIETDYLERRHRQ